MQIFVLSSTTPNKSIVCKIGKHNNNNNNNIIIIIQIYVC